LDRADLQSYLFLYPLGHFGFTALTFLTLLPLTQVIVVFLATATLVGTGEAIVGVGDGEATASS